MAFLQILNVLFLVLMTVSGQLSGGASGSEKVPGVTIHAEGDASQDVNPKMAKDLPPPNEQSRKRRDTSSSAGLVYTRWGADDCPSTAVEVYDGFAVGSKYDSDGGTSSYLCLPMVPDYGWYVTTNQDIRATVHSVEYEGFPDDWPNAGRNEYNVPCVVCEVTGRSKMFMYPGSEVCPTGWTREYYGHVMAARKNNRRTEAVCVDFYLDYFSGTGEETYGSNMNMIELSCATDEPCGDNYFDERELTCAVCTK